MNAAAVGGEIERLAATPGVRLALAATSREGLLVRSTGETSEAEPVAALFAAIFRGAEGAAAAHELGRPRLLGVRAGDHQILVAGTAELVLVVVAGQRANVGRMRLELLRAAEVLR